MRIMEESVSEVYEVLTDLISELKDIEPEDINSDMTFDELELESLDFVQLQVVYKKQFGVALDPAVFLNQEVKTVGEFCSYILVLMDN